MLLHVQLEKVNIIIAIPNPSPLQQQASTIQLCPQRLNHKNKYHNSRKYWRELNLAVEPKIAIARGISRFKFGGTVRDSHTHMRVGNFGRF